jgi:hypothetical protein
MKKETVISGSRAKILWHTQTYYPIDRPLSNTVDLFVSVGLLVAVLKFKEQTIRNGIHKHGISPYWSFIVEIASILINWATIPANSINRLGLPRDPAKMLTFLRANDKVSEEQFKSLEARQIKSTLEAKYHDLKKYCAKRKLTDKELSEATNSKVKTIAELEIVVDKILEKRELEKK